MKFLFVANNLSSGGIQTSLINILQYLSNNEEDEIDLFLFATDNERIKKIPNNINIIKGNYILQLTAKSFSEVLDSKRILDILVRIFLMLLVRIIKPEKYFNWVFKQNKNEKKYDFAISYSHDMTATYFCRGATQYILEFINADKKIGWIHSDIKEAKLDITYYKNVYNKLDKIVNVSNYCKQKYDDLIPEQIEKSKVVYNLFNIEKIKNESQEMQSIIKKDNNIINIITIARIANNPKRIDRIIEVAKKLVENGQTNFKWYIVGDGPNVKSIKDDIFNYKLDKYVILLGNQINPYPYLKASDLFVLTSDSEGYPMVIGESLVLGKPAIVTEYGSAREQIIDGENGFVVEKNTEGVYKKILEILQNPDIVINLQKNLKEKEFSNEKAEKQLEELFEK